LEIDVTQLSADEAAEAIKAHIEKVMKFEGPRSNEDDSVDKVQCESPSYSWSVLIFDSLTFCNSRSYVKK